MQREGQMACGNSSFRSSLLLPLDTCGLLKQPLSQYVCFSFLPFVHGTRRRHAAVSPHFPRDPKEPFISRVSPDSLPGIVRSPQLGQNLLRKVSFSCPPTVGLLFQHSHCSPFTGGSVPAKPFFPVAPCALSPRSVWAWPSCWAPQPQFPHLPKETAEASHPMKVCVRLHQFYARLTT